MQPLTFTTEQIVWQEVPNEVSLAFLVAGCPLSCKGCHSTDSWKVGQGNPLTLDYLCHRLDKYNGLLTCVLFMGGEWQADTLSSLLQLVQAKGLRTCLYTGLEQEDVPQKLLPYLTYLKTGRWIAERGGLDSPHTNQRFIDLRNGSILNHYFLKQDYSNDSITRKTA